MIPADLEAALRDIARAPALVLATDYDGVLSPIVADPGTATPDNGALVAFLAAGKAPGVTPVVVSGRSRSALIGFLGELDGVLLIGNHGADLGEAPEPNPEAVEIHRRLLEAARPYRGTHVEAKPFGAALHYRNARDRMAARDTAIRAAEALPGRAIEGKEVIEVVTGTVTKGTAIAEVRSHVEGSRVVYLGDDVTDEDVFVTLADGDVGIKVGPGPTAAAFRIDTVADVARVFSVLGDALDSVDGDR